MNFVQKFNTIIDQFASKHAIISPLKSISYREFFNRLNCIASQFVDQKIEKQLIGIYSKDPIEHICYIFGVLYSNNSYISITEDNYYYILNNNSSDITYIVGDKLENEKYIQLESNKAFIRSTVKFSRNSDAIFCSFLTSGSTGNPKLISHPDSNILNDTYRQIIKNKITSDDTIDLIFSFGFSASLASIFPALLTGATLIVYDLKNEGFTKLINFWKTNKVTMSCMSVSSFRTLCNLYSETKELNSLRFLSIGSEPVNSNDIQIFKKSFPLNVVLQVAYATTETRTISEYKYSAYDDIDNDLISSVGEIVQDKFVNIIDDNGNKLQDKQIGEIQVESAYIVGASLHRDSKKVFNTGDIGYIAGNRLYYLGRKSQEIKINGVKIDLFSIERLIKEFEEIDNAAVFIKRDNISSSKIYACYSCLIPLNKDDLRQKLSQNLPVSHLPHYLIQLDNFPKTYTGKIDRNKLIEITDEILIRSNLTSTKTYNTSTESTIIDIWQKHLKNPQISIDKDFFNDLNGDSLLALHCLADLEKRLKINLSTQIIYTCRTPEKLAKFIDYKLSDLIRIDKINKWIEGKKYVYFLGMYNTRDYNYLFDFLVTHFNLGMINVDLFTCSNDMEKTREIVKHLEKIKLEKSSIIIGYSFNGYLVHYMSLFNPEIITVLIDTPNYYEYNDYESNSLSSFFLAVLKQMYFQKNLLLPFYVALKFVSKVKKGEPIFVSRSLTNDMHVKSINNILYETLDCQNVSYADGVFIKANFGSLKSSMHGLNWKKYYYDSFKMIKFNANHVQILSKKNSRKICHQIIKSYV